MSSEMERLTEEEALEVLHEAIREQEAGASGEAEGISADSLRAIARESGIQDRFIDQALAKRLSRPAIERQEGLKPGEVVYSIQGELAEDQQSALLEVLGTQTIIAHPMPGVVQATVHGRGYMTTIQISVSGGRTHIRVTPLVMAGALYTLSFFGAFFLVMAVLPLFMPSLSPPAFVWAMILLSSAAIALPFWLVPRAKRRIQKEVAELAERVTLRIAEEVAAGKPAKTREDETT